VNLNVIQEILYVKQEEKLNYLIDCLKKTAPPVLIFSEHQNDVDDIHEYLLIKGVDVVGLHGGKCIPRLNELSSFFQSRKKELSP
jgi:ATP-dependent RNA helicase DDX41